MPRQFRPRTRLLPMKPAAPVTMIMSYSPASSAAVTMDMPSLPTTMPPARIGPAHGLGPGQARGAHHGQGGEHGVARARHVEDFVRLGVDVLAAFGGKQRHALLGARDQQRLQLQHVAQALGPVGELGLARPAATACCISERLGVTSAAPR